MSLPHRQTGDIDKDLSPILIRAWGWPEDLTDEILLATLSTWGQISYGPSKSIVISRA